MRDLARLGVSAVALLALIFVASLVLWVGVPVGWLWIGSKIQVATDNLGAAVGAMLFGAVATVGALVAALGWLTRAYQRSRTARGLEDTGSFPLEVTLVCSACVAMLAFVVWFFGFSGSAPLPVPEP
jgi:hypothetical protein